ncbi:sulfate adenylyltransferase, partial [Candidatus Bathyarchaeota archaeon]
MRLGEPHGGKLVSRLVEGPERERLAEEALELPKVVMDANTTMDFWQIATGGFSPLEGFMGRGDYERVLAEARLEDGLIWPLPVVLPVGEEAFSSVSEGDEVALAESSGRVLGLMEVEEKFSVDLRAEARAVYGYDDPAHPGVVKVLRRSDKLLAGPLRALKEPSLPFQELCRTPEELRAEFKARGWRTVAGFQTRNPPHRAHEHLQRIALELLDGLLIHPVLGEKKPGDFKNEAIIEAYRWLIENVYPKGRVVLSGLATWMRFAGPREALFHALVRKNYGCTHFIVGRLHASPSGWYGDYDAHDYIRQFDEEELGISILLLKGPFYCRACGCTATDSTCGHG